MLFKVIGIGLITVAATLTVKPFRPELAFIISVAGASAAFFLCVSELQGYFSAFRGILADSGINSKYFAVAIKSLGVGYICEFASNMAKDAGQNAMALKIVFAGRVTIFIIALPLISELLSLATELVGK